MKKDFISNHKEKGPISHFKFMSESGKAGKREICLAKDTLFNKTQ